MNSDSADTSSTDQAHRRPTVAHAVMLGVGGVLILVAAVTTFLAVRAEWQTANAKADTRAAESDLTDARADASDAVSRQVDLQAAAAQQTALRAQVVESWNAVATSNDTALSAATRAVALFNKGEVILAKQLLDTEASGALETSEKNLETLRGHVDELQGTVKELGQLLTDAEQP